MACSRGDRASMIMIDLLIQGTLGGGLSQGDYTPVPFPIYFEGDWHSTLMLEADLYDQSGNKLTLSHKSIDNGATYSVTNIDDTYAASISVQGTKLLPIPNLSGNSKLLEVSSIIRLKDDTADWTNIDLSSVPGGSFGGGTLSFVGFDDTNNEFIFIKNGGILGDDVFTTPDFVVFDSPSFGSPNPITDGELFSDVFAIHFISGQYVAFGLDESTSDNITATSSDLLNWTKQVAILPASTYADSSIAFFNSKYIIHRFENNGGILFRVLEIWSSSDGLTWTQATLPAQEATVAVQGIEFLVTAAAIELLTPSYVYRSTDGTTWTRTLLKNYLNQGSDGSTNGFSLANGKGSLMDSAAGPDHLAISNVSSLQLGGKLVHLTEVNAVPTLGYPSTAPEGAVVGWIQDNLSREMVIDDGFTLNNIPAAGTVEGHSLYARNTATTRYYEIEVLSSGLTTNKVGALGLGGDYVSGTDAIWFNVIEDLIEVSNGSDIVVTHSHTAGQILGFLFDFVAKTCVIEVDGVALATVPNVNNLIPWVIETTVFNGRFKLNVGQEAFSHNGTGATAWQTQ